MASTASWAESAKAANCSCRSWICICSRSCSYGCRCSTSVVVSATVCLDISLAIARAGLDFKGDRYSVSLLYINLAYQSSD